MGEHDTSDPVRTLGLSLWMALAAVIAKKSSAQKQASVGLGDCL